MTELTKTDAFENPCSHSDEEHIRYLGVGYSTGENYYKCDRCGYIFKPSHGCAED